MIKKLCLGLALSLSVVMPTALANVTLTDLHPGQAVAGYSIWKMNSRWDDVTWNGPGGSSVSFPKYNAKDWYGAVGITKNIALAYNQVKPDQAAITAGGDNHDLLSFKIKDIGLQYKLSDPNNAVLAGFVTIDSTLGASLSYNGTMINAGSASKKLWYVGIACNEKKEKWLGYTSLKIGSDYQDWILGFTYDITPNVYADTYFRYARLKNAWPQFGSNCPTQAPSGFGLGIGIKI